MIVNILIVICFVLAAIFPLAYLRSKWTLYLPGKALMFFSIIVASVMGLAVYRVFTGHFAPEWLRILSYSGIVTGLAFMDYVLLREQAKDRRTVIRKKQDQEQR